MKQNKITPVACSIGHVIFSILKVFSIIGAVSMLILILALSFLPAGTFEFSTSADFRVHLNSSIFGEEWKEIRDSLASGFDLSEDDMTLRIEESDAGLSVEGTVPTEAVGNRALALTLIPSLTETLILIFFYHFLAKICKTVKTSLFTPFSPDLPDLMKALAFSLFALAAVPYLTSSLIALIAKITYAQGSGLDLGIALWGLLALALGEIFRFGATLTPPAPHAPENPTPESPSSPDKNAF